MKLSSNIERISDQAVKIAERAHSLTRKPVLEEAATLGPMFIEARSMK
jgi:phosphate uptake regulator